MTNLDCGELLGFLSYRTDARKDPDNARRSQFLRGWAVATNGEQSYSRETLEQLTWNNLGYRLGEKFGTKSEVEINSLFDRFAEYYRENN